ncbi:MAG: hybrid sensor histidine kinase/response regulator [Rickettsiales bacterium]|nr:hybrid sensor histidine kinase/response regulator [Rickettsiales bacterium]
MSNFIAKIKQFLVKSFGEGTQIDRGNILTAVLIGAPTYIFLYFFYSYVVILPYESLTLRLTVAFLCSSVYFYKYLPETVKIKYFPFYWHVMVMAALTFSVTFLLLKNNFHEIYLYWEIFVTFLLALYVPNWLIFIIDLLISFSAAIVLYIITTPTSDIIDLSPQFNIAGYSFILFFTGFTSIIFIYANRSAWITAKENQQYKKVISIAGSIVHEIRNPLNSIRLAIANSTTILKSPNLDEKLRLKEVLNCKNNINNAIKQANDIINIVLNDLGEKTINHSDFKYLQPREIVLDVISSYGYQEESEKQKVKLNLNNYFIFKAIPERLIFIIYNLLKNALYYLDKYPNSIVTIGTEQRVFEGKNYNVIYVHDTGPGIPYDVIPKLFDDFFTFGKKGGTGLGLAFCKRNMIAFDGDIICESEVNEWTKFSLLFPILSNEEQIKTNIIENNKILIVDDEQVNLLIEKSTLERNLNVICDTINNGFEAVEILKKSKDYVAIIMDVEMPVMNGFDATKEIRKFNSSLPIITYSSLKGAKEKALESGANDFLNKPAKKELLLKTVAKWSNIKYDPFVSRSRQELKDILNNKRILLADDETTNRIILTKYLENYGMIIDQVKDGNELVAKYEASSHSTYDLIITDVNMYKVNGDEATIKIRKHEKENNLKQIPIIAFTGNSETEKLHHFFNVGMNDYFVKGDDNEYLIRIIGFWVKIA